MVPSGTVVMALAGQGKTRGTVAITNIDLCTNQSLAAIVTDDTVCDLCLLYYLETQYENLRAVSSGDGTRGGLNLQIISDYPVCLPSVEEQIKIADFFAVLDRKIDKQRALIDSLKKYKRGLLSAVFSRKLTFGAYEEWQATTISECLQYEQPQKYIVETEQYDDSYSTPVLTANKAFILGYTNESTGIYNKGDVIIYDDFTMDMKYVTFPFKVKSSTIKMLTPRQGFDLYFAYALLQSLELQPEGHQRSYISKVEPMIVKIPCYEEQVEISNFLQKCDFRVQQEEETLTKLMQLKSGLLQSLFI